MAASMASIIAMVGTTIIVPENSYIMIHNPAGVCFGGGDDMRTMADLLDHLQGVAAQTYAARTGQPVAVIIAMMDAETYLDAAQALALGFADQVEAPMQIAAKLDLSRLPTLPAQMRAALTQARAGRLHILDKMTEAMPGSRSNISKHAPRIVTIKIPVDKIRDVIGPGGKMIRSIIERTGVKIDVEDDGRVNIASADEAASAKALGMIQELTATPELNKTYLGKVQRITDFGAFVEIMAGTDGLLHVSEIANHRVKDVRDELKEGQQILVKVINIDPTGKIRLSRKALLQDEAQKGATPAPAAKE